jgi:hypothetical protein
MIETQPRNPQQLGLEKKKGDLPPLGQRNFLVDEKVLDFLFTIHTQGLETVPRPKRTNGQRKLEDVSANRRLILRIGSAPNFETWYLQEL